MYTFTTSYNAFYTLRHKCLLCHQRKGNNTVLLCEVYFITSYSNKHSLFLPDAIEKADRFSHIHCLTPELPTKVFTIFIIPKKLERKVQEKVNTERKLDF